MITALFTIASVLGSEIEDVLISVTVLIVAIAYRLAPLLGSLIIGLFVLVNRSYEVSVLIGIEDTDQMGISGRLPSNIQRSYPQKHYAGGPKDSIHSHDLINHSEAEEHS